MLKGRAGYPTVERGKIGYRSSWKPASTRLPRDRWFKLGLEVLLGIGNAGRSQILIDDRPVFDHRGTNMPDMKYFRSKFGVRLSDEKYDKVQVGITANGSSDVVSLFVDDIRIERQSGS